MSASRDDDVLASDRAGRLAIRGGIARVAAYGSGMALTAVASIFLLRHLGVEAFGRYATVIAIVSIVGGLADAGLTVVGQRLIVLTDDEAERRRLLGDIAGIRITIAPLGVLAGALFGLVVGYPSSMVVGTLIAGVGVLCSSAAVSLAIPLTVSLRLGAVALSELSRQVALTIAIAVLVVLQAQLLAFFVAQLASGAAMLAVTVALLGRGARVRPRFALREWGPLLREAAPVAASLVINVVYVRTLVIVVSLLGTARETGLFGTSSRILEIFVGIPYLMVGSAFPILAHAGAADEGRLRYALQRLGETGLLLSALLVCGLAMGARPIVEVLGGEGYTDAGPVLALQAFALVGAFLTQVWAIGLVALGAQRALVAINVVGLATVVALGVALVPPFGAHGAAAAAVVGELALAVAAVVALVRARPALRPSAAYAGRVLVVAALAAACALLPVGDVLRTVVALAVFGVAAWALRAIPTDVVHALLRRDAAASVPAP